MTEGLGKGGVWLCAPQLATPPLGNPAQIWQSPRRTRAGREAGRSCRLKAGRAAAKPANRRLSIAEPGEGRGAAAIAPPPSKFPFLDAQPGCLRSSRHRGAPRGRRSGLGTGFQRKGRGRVPHPLWRGSVNDEEPAAAPPGVLQVRAAVGALHAGAAARPLRSGRRPRRDKGAGSVPTNQGTQHVVPALEEPRCGGSLSRCQRLGLDLVPTAVQFYK
nr:uncharacterized protein LOC116277755 [Vicugna pacos]